MARQLRGFSSEEKLGIEMLKTNKGVVAAICATICTAGIAYGEPSDDISLTYVSKMQPGADMEAVLALVEEMRQAAKEDEGTLVWELAIVGDMAYGYERWDNEAAFMAHLESMGPFFPRMPDLWTTEQIVVLSPLPDTIETMLRQFNATIADTNVSKHID